MKKLYSIAALALLTAPLALAKPKKLTFKVPSKPYTDAMDRADYYKKNVFTQDAALKATGAAFYVVMTNTPVAPLVGYLGSADNLIQWKADKKNNPSGGSCAHDNTMIYYDGNYKPMYMIKGPYDKESSPLSSFTITSVGNAPAEAKIAPDPKNHTLVGLTRPALNNYSVETMKTSKEAHQCLFPSIYLPAKNGNFNIAHPVPIQQTKIANQFTDMVLFGYNQLSISTTGKLPILPPTPKDLKTAPGIGGILYYDKNGDFVCAFYTNGWASHKEGWTTEAPKGLETLAAQGCTINGDTVSCK